MEHYQTNSLRPDSKSLFLHCNLSPFRLQTRIDVSLHWWCYRGSRSRRKLLNMLKMLGRSWMRRLRGCWRLGGISSIFSWPFWECPPLLCPYNKMVDADMRLMLHMMSACYGLQVILRILFKHIAMSRHASKSFRPLVPNPNKIAITKGPSLPTPPLPTVPSM